MRNAPVVSAFALACCAAVAGCADDDLAAGSLLLDAPETEEQAIHNVCPDGETTYGIDVSVYQGDIDWARVAGAGVKYAIIRVGDGMGGDSKFNRNWQGAKANGIVRGAYQFWRSNLDPIAQADHLLEIMGPLEPGDLPPVVDVESTDGVSNAVRAERLQQWLDHVEAATGLTPIIYTGGYFWQDNVGRDFSRYPLWHAGYTGGTCPSTVANQWPDWTFWQFGSTGRVAGINGNVDEDRFNGSLADLQRWARHNTMPRGYVDAATCAGGIAGWAQDEDTPNQAIDVHAYIDDNNHVVRANDHRDDLCAAIGSCNHGYVVDIPNKFRDGADHTVVVWGIDDQGQHSILSGSGMTFRCDPPALPEGILRHITSPDVMTAWGFSFEDVARYSDAALADRVHGDAAPAAPRLIRADGDPAVYVVDVDGTKRWVTNPDSFAAWHFDGAAIEVLAVDVAAAIPRGPDLLAAPILLRGDGPAVYVLDVVPAPAVVVGGEGEGEEVSEGEGEGEGVVSEGEGEGGVGFEGEGEGVVDDEFAGDDNVRVVTVGNGAAACCAAAGPGAPVGLVVLLLLLRRRSGSRRHPA